MPLPMSYANATRGGAARGGGDVGQLVRRKVRRWEEFFAQFAVEPKSYLKMYPEMSVPDDQKQAFLQERAGR